jgi:tRNA threonylcarbamoyladenosine dehydratase
MFFVGLDLVLGESGGGSMGASDGGAGYSGKALFNRTERLVGAAAMHRLAEVRVIVFGIGGVGSWCAESLVRTGIGELVLVDSDRVCVTNINRQLQATCRTVGQVKVVALRERLLEINPHAVVQAEQKIYAEATADDFDLAAFDVVVDAIDSVSNKILLLYRASRTRAAVFSSLGAACKVDPTRIRVADFMHVKGCPLGAKLRKQMRRTNMLPVKPVMAVYSDEVLENAGVRRPAGLCSVYAHRGGEGRVTRRWWGMNGAARRRSSMGPWRISRQFLVLRWRGWWYSMYWHKMDEGAG